MDALVFIMIGCAVAALSGISFMELRKIRKHLERRPDQRIHADTSRNAA
jgi:hypothetical protein